MFQCMERWRDVTAMFNAQTARDCTSEQVRKLFSRCKETLSKGKAKIAEQHQASKFERVQNREVLSKFDKQVASSSDLTSKKEKPTKRYHI